jgi:uncharacterized protein
MANRLMNESSPYLRQHANNPVDWYPWGPEALERARAEDKPLLVSIGYSACHWCHVMEHESFEDPQTAAIMNERFVNVKVDREERPDLDHVYMTAVQGMTGHGGWPMTVFLTPDGKPFYGGTYFPPTDRGNMPSFQRVLISVSEAFRSQRPQIGQQADKIAEYIDQQNLAGSGQSPLDTSLLDDAMRTLLRRFDEKYGGFGGAPKFPQAMALDFLLRTYFRTRNETALAMVESSLQHMAWGGIYDQIGGGFHRYTVDGYWVVPHFEKMLYDNALLVRVYLHAYQITGASLYRRIVEETLDYVKREMQDADGGFYSTLDADSEGVEGKFYVWSPEEFDQVVGAEYAPVLRTYFGVTPHGNFEHTGTTILTAPPDPAEVAAKHDISEEELAAIVALGSARLFEARSPRVRPARDEKIISAWNGLMLRSYAEAARVLERPEDLETARRNAEFLLSQMWREGHMLRIHKDGVSKIPGYLEDFAAVADGLLALYEATFETRWFTAAREIADRMVALFWDVDRETFFDTARDAEQLVSRPRELWDNATPSGTSLACNVLLRLWALTGEAQYERVAEAAMGGVADLMREYAVGFGNLLSAVDFLLAPPQEIAVVGDPQDAATAQLLEPLRREFLPSAVVALDRPDDQAAQRAIPLLEGRSLVDGKPAAYVCRAFVCNLPVTTPAALLRELGL